MSKCKCLTNEKCAIHPCTKHQQKYTHWFKNRGKILYVMCEHCKSTEVFSVSSIPDNMSVQEFIDNCYGR
jgi:hypothetical protein